MILRESGEPELAEAVSCREAFSWLKNKGILKVSNILDAQNNVNCFNNYVSFVSPIGIVLDDFRKLVRSFR